MKTIIPSPQPVSPAFGKNRSPAFTLIELLVATAILAILAGVAIPVFTLMKTKEAHAQNLHNAQSIGLGLRLYAVDHKGLFPTSAASANSAYQKIVPIYIPTRKIFYLAGSGWSTGTHPVELGTGGTLAAGQNAFAYVSGLRDSDNTNYPLVADGFNAGAPGVYNSVQGTKGGVWKGTKAAIVRVDDSATIEAVTQSDYKVYSNGMNTDSPSADIFTTGATWMPSASVMNPQ